MQAAGQKHLFKQLAESTFFLALSLNLSYKHGWPVRLIEFRAAVYFKYPALIRERLSPTPQESGPGTAFAS
jgi:hypothetical protein